MGGMPHRTLTIDEVTEYLHLARREVDRLLRETDLPHEVRGGRMLFRRSAIDEWASRRILHLPGKRLDLYHEGSMRATRALFPDAALIPELLRRDTIDLSLRSKTPASVIRDMVALAEKTSRVLDPRELLNSIREREALCSTGLPGGLALLHARHLAPYRFDGSFVVLGRTVQPVPFGAPDGRPTRLFFLLGCEDERIHLHALARLCLLAMKTEVGSALHEVATADAAYDALVAAEKAVLPAPPTAGNPRRSARAEA